MPKKSIFWKMVDLTESMDVTLNQVDFFPSPKEETIPPNYKILVANGWRILSLCFMDLRRFFRHLFTTQRSVRKYFPKESIDRITEEIRKSESLHNGEIVFAIEAAIHPILAAKGYSGRQRAIELFSILRVWDTEENNGVMIYLLLADHDIEIVSDRGVTRLVGNESWERICKEMSTYFREGNYLDGVIHGIHSLTAILTKYYPKTDNNPNELPDVPVIV